MPFWNHVLLVLGFSGVAAFIIGILKGDNRLEYIGLAITVVYLVVYALVNR